MKSTIKTVLIVDDTSFMRMVLKDTLIKNGFIVIGEAESGRKAINMYRKLNPDIVIMDITMPDISGIEAVYEILKINSEAKVIMCSAIAQKKLVIAALKAGAKDYIVKPFNDSTVIETINKVIRTNF